MKHFAVFGNPTGHSKSPHIHQLFAKQTAISISYQAIQSPLDAFEAIVSAFFAGGGDGANITLPFKERAYALCGQLTARAKIAGAVNTLQRLGDEQLLGDNTDGVGLLSDLQRLNMIKPGDRVLLIGAGGAARGVIHPLLSSGCQMVIANRTLERAQQLAALFTELGIIEARAFTDLAGSSFNLIINATSSGVKSEVPAIPTTLFQPDSRCYDMFYQPQLTPFLQWAKQHGVQQLADGLGMLVGQAAHAFALWNGIMPNVEPVLTQLRAELKRG